MSIRLPFALGLAVLANLAWASPAAETPPALREWTQWALHGETPAECALLNLESDAQQRVCAWPGRLRLAADASGARFGQRWRVLARSAVPLPGGGEHWPLAVSANGQAIAVVADASGHPQVWLEAGEFELAGRFEWQRRPESLPVPAVVALIELAVDDAPVFPLQRAGDALWLGQAASAVREADALSLQVFRRLSDDVPARLDTTILLQVSGEGREVDFGVVLPEGFVPVGLDGDLPARIDERGALRAQLRPGSHQVQLAARAVNPLVHVARPPAAADWPAQEIWSYAAAPRLRVTDATGAPAIDPAQAGVPAGSAQLPAFVLEAGGALDIEERSRGLSPQDQNRLRLARQWWLDFDGGGWTLRDRIDGRMVRDWRLDLAQPLLLTRASDAQALGLLVTRGATAGLNGVELREHGVVLEASARVDDALGTLPVSGWQQPFDQVDATLNLPPGWRLYAALGADQAPTSWLAQWNLLDMFLVALAALMGFWLLGAGGAVLVLAYLLLGYREYGAPVLSVIAVLGLGLFLRLLPEGRLAWVVRWLRMACLLLLTLLAFGFAAQQLRLAIYPQLERNDVTAQADYSTPAAPRSAAEGAPQAEAMEQPVEADKLESITVVGSRRRQDFSNQNVQGNASRMLQRYANNAQIQAGGGEPGWNWGRHPLSWSGPVLPDQQVHLLLSPPWMTRLLRVLAVTLLALLLLRMARGTRSGLRVRPLAAVALCALFAGGTAIAQPFPPQELLDALRERALEPPACAPRCGRIASAAIDAAGDRVQVLIEAHAVERVGLPLPFAEQQLELLALRVDGRELAEVLRRADGDAWVVIERGVHRIEMDLRSAATGRVALRFPQAPARVLFSARDWEAAGLRDGKLLTDTLELVRVRSGAAATSAAEGQQFPAFVVVERNLVFDLDWRIDTTVRRVAPLQGGMSVQLPLLPGERVTSAAFKVADGSITVPLQPGEQQVAWSSQLDRAPSVVLTAPSLEGHAETWRVIASPTWNLQFSGVPAVYPADENDWQHEFHPVPGEVLEIVVGRPEPVLGATLAIDSVVLDSTHGRRATTHALALGLRSTQGGQHTITLPAEAELLSVTIDGEARNLRAEQGRIALPLRPGSQSVLVSFRTLAELGTLAHSPQVALGAPATNLRLGINLPRDRWLLATWGPKVGPAVLYWSALAVLLLAAFGLSRLRRTPLRLRDWVLLGLGFSTFSWPAMLLVVAWLFALDARARWAGDLRPLPFNALQVALATLTVVALLALLSAVPQGLLGTPDMQVEGNGSSAWALRWFDDRSADALPQATALSVSIWWYKGAMLLWALWLANALVGWLRWAWTCWSHGGYWQRVPTREPAPLQAVSPQPAPPPPRPE